MTEEQRQLCRYLVIFPNGQRRITEEEFLRQFPSAVERGKLAPKWLQEAYEARHADDLCCAFIVGGTFGFAPEHKEILRLLIEEDWHYCHEDAVSVLTTWPTPDMVEALFRATQWIPTSLKYDDSRALAVKAIWALGGNTRHRSRNETENTCALRRHHSAEERCGTTRAATRHNLSSVRAYCCRRRRVQRIRTFSTTHWLT